MNNEKNLKTESDIHTEMFEKVINQLQSLINQINQKIEVNKQKNVSNKMADSQQQAKNSLQYSTAAVSQGPLSLYSLSHQLLNRQFATLWDYYQQRNQELSPTIKHTIIWGWDDNSLQSFSRRFLSQILSHENTTITENPIIHNLDEGTSIAVINESTVGRSIEKVYQYFHGKDYNLYLLINTIQIGAAQKQLANSRLLHLPDIKEKVVNLVSESFREFKTADNSDECILSLSDVANQLERNSMVVGEWIINDSNPIYSMILAELRKLNDITITDEQQLYYLLSTQFSYLILGEPDMVNVPGIILQGSNFECLHSKSNFSDHAKHLLRMYKVKVE